MNSEPQKEHEWLQQLVGEWSVEITASMGPDQPPTNTQGTETVRSLGGLWTLGEGQGVCPDGSPVTSLMTLGFDSAKGRYVGSFIASMMSMIWHYDGALDADRKALVLDTEGPSMAGDGAMAKYQDVITFLSPGHRTLTSRALGPDGQWTEFMSAHYRRKA
ncbi:DUF1579 domain-containing protein [Bosea sp. TAB14]|jgi:hypothetical protein|uniref:DUF1579 domain-containing protein n=1 Tax=Bosea sp. TAB14 TaxID=3237481 RepID=UPI003F8F53CB